jgi:sigma-B regulation protein RsbU (phosphoserine phosphatase)
MEAQAQLTALEQELEIAARIQTSMIPQTFEFPGCTDVNIYAKMIPARRVGGDFYDFFVLGEDLVGFLIGDVAGKGIPAALFMAETRALLRASALQGVPPHVCFRYANEILAAKGDSSVYVTAFYAILNTRSGRLDYCLAGHNPPYRVLPSGQIEAIEEPGSLVIGLLPDAPYEGGTMWLDPGDTIFLFTDGVTEATSAGGQFFEESQLRNVLAQTGGMLPKTMVETVQSAVACHSKGTTPSDDVTAMAVNWKSCTNSRPLQPFEMIADHRASTMRPYGSEQESESLQATLLA